MEIIERYLNAVGRNLTKKGREDLLAEIRSHLEDSLDERTHGKPTEEDAVALLKEVGSPRKMAASYSPQLQYLVGPELYPLFSMVIRIVLAATIGAQLLALGIDYWNGAGNTVITQTLLGLVTSIPASVGWVVVVFMILQNAGVKPKLDEDWDPRSLPAIENEDEIKRGELIFGITAGSIFLALLAVMPEKIGVYNFSNGEFFVNPIILQYLPLICASLLVGIGLDIYLLWRGSWNIASRAVQFAADLLAIVVLALLYQGHTEWLAARGSTGMFYSINLLNGDFSSSFQIFGMEAFRMAFGVALVVIVVQTIVKIVKMILKSLRIDRQSRLLVK